MIFHAPAYLHGFVALCVLVTHCHNLYGKRVDVIYQEKSYLTFFVHFFDGHFSAYHFPLKGILLMFQADDEVEYWKQGGQGPRIPKGWQKM